jgi:hypothetical protein
MSDMRRGFEALTSQCMSALEVLAGDGTSVVLFLCPLSITDARIHVVELTVLFRDGTIIRRRSLCR